MIFIVIKKAIVFLLLSSQLPEKQAVLFVNGLEKPFATMPYSKDLNKYDNKIIECSYRGHQWHFHRERTDKSFPNAKGMLNCKHFL